MIQFETPANLVPKGYQQLTGITSSTQLTVPDGAAVALIGAEAQNVRFRDDGGNPSGTVGQVLVAGQNPILFRGNLDELRVFEDASGAILNVNYYGHLA